MKNTISNLSSTWKASVLLVFFVFIPGVSTAQRNPASVEPKKLAVEVVSVRNVGRLHGIVLDQNQHSISIVVRREWLKQKLPKFWKLHAASEGKELEEDAAKVKQRIKTWREEYDGDDAVLIDEFLDDNEKLLGLDNPVDVGKMKFTIVTLDREEVRKIYRQSAERRQLVGIGWSENIENVETTNATVLKRKLENKEVNIAGYQLQLGNEMPPVFESSDKWFARKALVEFALLSRVEYQGTGTMFFRRGTTPDPAQAIKAMMGGGFGGMSQIEQLGRELGLPEFQDRSERKNEKAAWLKPMIETAKKENRRCFSVSKLTQGETVSVRTSLYFEALDGRWYPLAEFASSERLADQSTDDLDLLKDDPQISQAMKLIEQLGIGDTSVIDKAMRSGAATKRALEKSMAELDEFVDRYSFEIDNPPIEVPQR